MAGWKAIAFRPVLCYHDSKELIYMYTHRIATPEDLEILWNRNIAENPDDPNWVRWKQEFVSNNEKGLVKTFAVLHDGDPVGEGSLILTDDHPAIRGQTRLADGKITVNINALRIRKEHEGRGEISRLVRMMEDWAREKGFQTITIGVEAAEARNLAIYLHWGYTNFISHEMDGDALVLYYGKAL